MKIGDKIKDIEDGDCYYYGTVTDIENGEVTEYLLEGVFWNNEEDKEFNLIGEKVKPFWYYIEKA